MDQERAPGSKFYVLVRGRTNGAHQAIVDSLKSIGQTEVTSHGQSDYLLVFCPVASRVGTDIGEALESIPGGRPIILVVMHHTFDRDHVVADSRRQVTNSNVILTVDYLFYEGKLLISEHNNQAWSAIKGTLGVSIYQVIFKRAKNCCICLFKWSVKHWKVVGIFGLVLMVYGIRRPALTDKD